MKKIHRITIIFLLIAFFIGIYSTFSIKDTLKFNDYPFRLCEETFVRIQQESNPLSVDKTQYNNLIENAKKLNTVLTNCSEIRYYEFYNQPLYLYNNNDREEIKCMQISNNIIQDFSVNVKAGRNLEKEDFQYRTGFSIPIIIGSKLSNKFSLNDTFVAEYLFNEYIFEVIGILSPDSDITVFDKQNLDDCILMPSINFLSLPTKESEVVSQLLHYCNKDSGIIKLSSPQDISVLTDILQIINQSKMGEFSWYSNDIVLNYRQRGINIEALAITFFLLFICAGCIMVIALIAFLKMRIDVKMLFHSRAKKTNVTLLIVFTNMCALGISKLILNKFLVTSDYETIFLVSIIIIICILFLKIKDKISYKIYKK